MSVQTGLAVLAAENFKRLSGHKIGLITNPTGVLPSKITNIAAMRSAGVNLKALFGPEHGVRGDVPAGKYIESYTDKATGLPVYSLYGKTRQPTAAMLKGLDVLVFELQDIGARSYTYLSSLGAVLEASAKHKIPVIVLDRPNTAGLQAVEGGPTRAGFASFISKYPVCYRHGMTLGEVGKMLIGEGMVNAKADLTVVPCKNLTRAMFWENCGLPQWVPTSPNIPTPDAAWLYHATGIIGESSQISIGIGTDAPFGYLGAPGLDERNVEQAFLEEKIAGFVFKAATWVPKKGAFAGQKCAGVRVIPVSKPGISVTYLNFTALTVFKQIAPKLNIFADAEETRMVDLSCGTDAVRKAFLRGGNVAEMINQYEKGTEEFKKIRQKYLNPAYR
jgi:uncharacterized protein YbbC (DUF1343 family)